jgi:nucleotide-binding universal stress UspA family protein
VFTTIAVATDYSPSALNALDAAEGLARHLGAKLAIIHVQEVTVGRGGTFVHSNQAALAALYGKADRLRREGIETTVSVSRATGGRVTRTIVDLAAKAGADLLVVGNSGHGPLAGLVLGSVALELQRAARFPVLTVPFSYSPATSTEAAERTPAIAPVGKQPG